MRGQLVSVKPRNGDHVRIFNLDSRDSRRHFDGTIDDQAECIQAFSERGMAGEVPVIYLGRRASVRIQPDWDGRWFKHPVYIEIKPDPREGDRVHPRRGDGHYWDVDLVLFGTDRYAKQAIEFDRHHFVVARFTSDDSPVKYQRMWVRWSYSSHAFIPVNDPELIRKLMEELPR